VLLTRLGVDVNVVAPMGASPSDLARLGDADFNIQLYPEIAGVTASWLERRFGQKSVKTVPIGVNATRAFIAEVAALAGTDATEVLADPANRLPWYSRSVDANYLTGKRVFVFGDATHAIAAANVAAKELGFAVVGLGSYSREFGRELRAAAASHGVEALISDDYLEVEAAIAAAQPDLVLAFVRAMKASAEEMLRGPLEPIVDRASAEFDIPGIRDKTALIRTVKGDMDLWLSEGRQNLLMNVPALWTSARTELAEADLADIQDVSKLYTNRFVDQANRT